MARLFLVLCLAWLTPWPSLAQPRPFEAQVLQWGNVFQGIADRNEQRLLVGDLEGYVEEIRGAVQPDDWISQFVAGNVVYRVSPAAAVSFHEAAARLAPGEARPQLELAFDHQRAGRCDRAVPAWEAADRLGILRSPATAIAAYCFFRLGRIDEAIALWERVQWPAHRRSLDQMLSEMAMGTRALDTHMRAYERARAGDEAALETLISNALRWHTDFWNGKVHRDAFAAARALALTVRPADARLHRELDCAELAIATVDADAVLGLLRRCRFIVEGGELPASSAVAKFLFARLDLAKAVHPRELLPVHGAELDRRARSAQGDVAALEVLAFLQASVRDAAGLAATDELGWRRYRMASFAASRVAGAWGRGPENRGPAETLLREAIAEFPGDANLHWMRFEKMPPAAWESDRYLMEWLFAEYEGLCQLYPVQGVRTSWSLVSVVSRLLHSRRQGLKL